MVAGKIVVGLVALVGAVSLAPHFDREVYDVHVTKSERIGGDEGKYMVFTKLLKDGVKTDEVRVFENTDSWTEALWGDIKTDSSDLYANIDVGKNYRLSTYGWRFSPFSWYENIKTAEPLLPDQ